MPRAVRSIAYVFAFIASATTSAFVTMRGLPLLPLGGAGLPLLLLLVVGAAMAVAKFERRWMRPREPAMVNTVPRSSLLAGNAPPPLSLGVVVGVLVALKVL